METKNIMIVGVGGQGSLLASKLLGHIFLKRGSKALIIVLIGKMSHYFDIPEEAWIEAIEEVVPPKFTELNKKAFKLGREA